MRPLRLFGVLLLPLATAGCIVAADVGPPVAHYRPYYGPPAPRYYYPPPPPRYYGYGYGRPYRYGYRY